ncbi:tubulin-specific chaperone C [Patagioenas fasciata monilis]|uniref:Tubulin-specific chaperone C n=1 Tax=Patagioenas fasciata monilis TaxID=372326 RepID=A0A1V4JJJ2_PATFA|nr:tubulin-specific chaperone C [Patagioenas fasciata monilis]
MEAAGEAAAVPAEELRAAAAFVAPLRPEPAAAAAVVLPERLQRREAERQQGVERQRQKKEAQVVKEEQSEFFVAAFSREREAVEALLAAGPLEEAAARLQGLQKLLTESVRFLAPYELRQGQEAVARLQGDLAARRQQLQPKKKFAFRALKKEAAPGSEPRPEEPAQPAAAEPAPCPGTAEGEPGGPPLCGFSGAENQELELGPAELLQRDVLLSQLRGCRVRLRGNANTVRVRDCRGCTVLCGPVSTSVMVDGCSDCVLVLACQQLRTHRTRDSRFYVQVTSRAVIEDCTKVSFAPYAWSYPGIERDFESSGLDRSRNNWNLVDDFDWLATDRPSPNWSLIPEQERISCWD